MSETTTTPAVANVPAAKPRKRKRIFMWTFLAIQAGFLAWIISGATAHGPSDATQIAQACYNHAWWPLFKSQANCVVHYGGALNTAGHIGQGIALALIVALWVAADVILGVGRLIVVFARRKG